MNGIVAMTKTVPKTGSRSLRPSRSSRLLASQLERILPGSARVPEERGTGGPIPIAPPGTPAVISFLLLRGWIPGLLHERPDLLRSVGHHILSGLLTGQRLVELGTEDRLHGVPLVSSRAPVGWRLERVGQDREIGIGCLERRVLEDARPGRDAAVLRVRLLRIGLQHPLDHVGGGLLG